MKGWAENEKNGEVYERAVKGLYGGAAAVGYGAIGGIADGRKRAAGHCRGDQGRDQKSGEGGGSEGAAAAEPDDLAAECAEGAGEYLEQVKAGGNLGLDRAAAESVCRVLWGAGQGEGGDLGL